MRSQRYEVHIFVCCYGHSGESTRILIFIHGRPCLKKCLCSIREQYTNQSNFNKHEIGKEGTGLLS